MRVLALTILFLTTALFATDRSVQLRSLHDQVGHTEVYNFTQDDDLDLCVNDGGVKTCSVHLKGSTGHLGVGIEPTYRFHVEEDSSSFASFIENKNSLGGGIAALIAGNTSSQSIISTYSPGGFKFKVLGDGTSIFNTYATSGTLEHQFLNTGSGSVRLEVQSTNGSGNISILGSGSGGSRLALGKSTSGGGLIDLTLTEASGGSGDVRIYMSNHPTLSTGDLKIVMTDNATTWALGFDNTDNGFKISKNYDLGTTTYFEINTSGQTTIAKDLTVESTDGTTSSIDIKALGTGAGYALLSLSKDATVTGDLQVFFDSSVDWSIGMDATDNNFKLGKGGALGSDTYIELLSSTGVKIPKSLEVTGGVTVNPTGGDAVVSSYSTTGDAYLSAHSTLTGGTARLELDSDTRSSSIYMNGASYHWRIISDYSTGNFTIGSNISPHLIITSVGATEITIPSGFGAYGSLGHGSFTPTLTNTSGCSGSLLIPSSGTFRYIRQGRVIQVFGTIRCTDASGDWEVRLSNLPAGFSSYDYGQTPLVAQDITHGVMLPGYALNDLGNNIYTHVKNVSANSNVYAYIHAVLYY